LAHVLVGEPVSTSPEHALARKLGTNPKAGKAPGFSWHLPAFDMAEPIISC
jgi:hypothetical protein